MSSDSESEEQMRQLREASDATLLSNEMFQKQHKSEPQSIIANDTKDGFKSQRLVADSAKDDTDLQLPEAVKRHISKKLSELIQEQVEFCHTLPHGASDSTRIRTKSRVRLLHDADCYVKCYEEFEYDTRGTARRMPEIKRRCVEPENESAEQRLELAVVEAEDIIAGAQSWQHTKQRADKVFHYNAGNNGALHAKEPVNEFTQLRRKNKWNESKIRQERVISNNGKAE